MFKCVTLIMAMTGIEISFKSRGQRPVVFLMDL
jgi:hypothetical protein